MLSIRELRDRAAIRPVKRAVEDQLLDLPGVTAVDIGVKRRAGRCTGEQVIVVSVASKKPLPELSPEARVPATIFGIGTDVIEERPVLQHIHRSPKEVVPRPRGKGTGTVRGGGGISPRRTVRMRPPAVPLPGGYRRIGTLGVLVTGNGVPMGLTTFDVACLDDAWSVGDQMTDPEAGRVCAGLARAALSARVDAAAVTITSGVDTAAEIAGIGQVTGMGNAHPGCRVRKTGYGTGLTAGVVTSVDATLRIDHGETLGVRVLREQIRIAALGECYCGPGDSGAAVVDADGRVGGLHVAGVEDGSTGFACPIADVLAELDAELLLVPRRLSV